MKLGLESLKAPKSKKVVRISSKDLAVQSAIATEAYMSLVETTNVLDTLGDVYDNISDVKVSVEQFGITDQLIGLVGEEISSIAPTFDKKDTKGVTIALEASLKTIGENIVKWIKKVIENVKNFFAKLFSAQKMAIAILEKQVARLTAIKQAGDKFVWNDPNMQVREAFAIKNQSPSTKKAIEAWNIVDGLVKAVNKGKWEDNKAYEKLLDGSAIANVKAALENAKKAAVKSYGDPIGTYNFLLTAVKDHKYEFAQCSTQSKNLKSISARKLDKAEGSKQSPQKVVSAASKLVTAYGRYELTKLRQNIAMAKNISADDKD